MKIFKHSIENFCEMLLIVYSTQYPNCVFLYLFQMRWWTWPLMDLDVSYIRKRGIEIKNELFAKPHRTHWRTITKSLLSLIWAKTYTARSLWIQKTSHLRLPGSYWLTTPIMKNVLSQPSWDSDQSSFIGAKRRIRFHDINLDCSRQWNVACWGPAII